MDPAEVLMSPNFGAFGGLEVNQQTALRTLEAQKRLGEIAGQPAEQRQREAHARLFEAEAAEKEENTAGQKRMAELMKGMAPGTSGATGPTPTDLANQMIQLGGVAMRSGLLKQGEDLLTKGTTVLQHVAAADASQASVALRQARATQAVLDQVGGLAASATDQASYDQTRMALMSDPQLTEIMKKRGIDPSRLPADYYTAKPLLNSLTTSVIKAKDILAATEKRRVDDAEISKFGAQAGAASASASASRARADVLRLREADINKNGGDTSNGAREARRATAEARDNAAAAKETKRLADEAYRKSLDAKRFPPPTPDQIKDPSKLSVGQTYSTPRGVLTWTGKGWVKPGGASAAPAARAPIADTSDEEDDAADAE